MVDVKLSVHQPSLRRLERAMLNSERGLSRELPPAYQEAASVIAKQARRTAPRSKVRGRDSLAVGPLSTQVKARRGKAADGLVISAPFYKNFVEAGTAGLKRVTPRPFIRIAIRATQREWERVLKSRLLKILRRHGLEVR